MLIKDDGRYDESVLEKLILKAIKEEELKTVRDLVAYLEKAYDLPKRAVLSIVTHMKEKGKLIFHKKDIQTSEGSAFAAPKPQSFIDYLQSPQATDFWVTLTFTVAATVASLLIPEDLYPAAFLRWVLGALFVFFLPGYALTTAIFPLKDLDSVEEIALSFGLSLAVTPLLGLMLNFTPWGITLTPILICLAMMTGVAMTIGAYRKAKTMKAPV
ncbi:MAG: DUF1616 domain-containing protein [Promethearchaeota archaeon]